MREASGYLSKEFIDFLWPEYEKQLKNRTSRTDYFTAVCSICDFVQKDFIEINYQEAQNYFQMLLSKLSRYPSVHADSKTVPVDSVVIKTVNNRLSALRSIMNYMMDSQILKIPDGYYNIYNRIEVPPYEFRILPSDIPSKSEVIQLLEKIKAHQDLAFYLLISLVVQHGMTAKEVCSLKQSQLFLREQYIRLLLYPATKKKRVIVIRGTLYQLLLHYLNAAENLGREYLFYNRLNRCLTVRNAEAKLKKYGMECGIRSFTMQDLRNLCICCMLKSGMSVKETAAYLGVAPVAGWYLRYEAAVSEIEPVSLDEFNLIKEVPFFNCEKL